MIPIIPINYFKPINTTSPVLGDATLSGLTNPPPLSLYIHIPWCVKKCPYCDFNSHESRTDIPEKRYVAALIADLEQSVHACMVAKLKVCFLAAVRPVCFRQNRLMKF